MFTEQKTLQGGLARSGRYFCYFKEEAWGYVYVWRVPVWRVPARFLFVLSVAPSCILRVQCCVIMPRIQPSSTVFTKSLVPYIKISCVSQKHTPPPKRKGHLYIASHRNFRSHVIAQYETSPSAREALVSSFHTAKLQPCPQLCCTRAYSNFVIHQAGVL